MTIYITALYDASGRITKMFGPCDYESCVDIAKQWRYQGTTRLLKLTEIAEWNPPLVTHL